MIGWRLVSWLPEFKSQHWKFICAGWRVIFVLRVINRKVWLSCTNFRRRPTSIIVPTRFGAATENPIAVRTPSRRGALLWYGRATIDQVEGEQWFVAFSQCEGICIRTACFAYWFGSPKSDQTSAVGSETSSWRGVGAEGRLQTSPVLASPFWIPPYPMGREAVPILHNNRLQGVTYSPTATFAQTPSVYSLEPVHMHLSTCTCPQSLLF